MEQTHVDEPVWCDISFQPVNWNQNFSPLLVIHESIVSYAPIYSYKLAKQFSNPFFSSIVIQVYLSFISLGEQLSSASLLNLFLYL